METNNPSIIASEKGAIKIVNSSKIGVETIHFHMKHYLATALPFMEYFMLLLYEEKNDWSIEELMGVLGVSNRTVWRIRESLISNGYLVKTRVRQPYMPTPYKLTDKAYK